jgi:hypothetical protein
MLDLDSSGNGSSQPSCCGRGERRSNERMSGRYGGRGTANRCIGT